MISAKEAREITEKNKGYSLFKIESDILFSAKQGETSYSFFTLDQVEDSILETLSNLGYKVCWYPASAAGEMLQYIISW